MPEIDNILLKKTFDKFRIENSYQDTGELDITYFDQDSDSWPNNMYSGNARNTRKNWVINKFRDTNNIPDGTDPSNEWAYKKRMEDKYNIVHLIKENTEGEIIFLFSSDINYKQSIR